MKAYKGFNRDMTCRGFQYEEGKSYEMEDAKLCDHGFHACQHPLDCLGYYAPSESVYHVVDQENITEESGDDTKQASSRIKIGARLDIAGLVAASIKYVKEKVEETNSATGIPSTNSATGNWSANSATGDWSANSATGYGSANSATGNRSANSATGNRSANSATGNRSANSATGDQSANSATGYGSANISTGCDCSNTSGREDVISVGWGKDNRCRGVIGSYLVLVERDDWDGAKYPIIGEPVLVKVDGEKIKENVWYMLKNGAVTAVEDEN